MNSVVTEIETQQEAESASGHVFPSEGLFYITGDQSSCKIKTLLSKIQNKIRGKQTLYKLTINRTGHSLQKLRHRKKGKVQADMSLPMQVCLTLLMTEVFVKSRHY